MMSSSLTNPVLNVVTSSPSGGRFDFDDGGTYCGGWQDGKAHGHGVCTGPKNVGEYSGSWNFGFEISGVYKWTNGAVYEGRWQNGKRHGVGVEYNGKWIYKGEWSQGSKGRYGVKASSNSAVKYEGTWANGLQDGYGSETYSDGGYYQGQMCRGLRHGYGVRKSAPYGDSQLNNPNKNGQMMGGAGQLSSSMMIHSNSLQSAGSIELDDDSPKPEDGFKPNIDRTLASKNGFVLVAKPLDVPMPSASSKGAGGGSGGGADSGGGNSGGKSGGARRNSLTSKLASARIPGSNQTASLLRGLRLRKQKSTSDLDISGGRGAAGSGDGRSSSRPPSGAFHDDGSVSPAMFAFTLSPEELDITDPTTVETYTGEWKHDKRNGHGVCERSDGLRYEGQWHNDMKCGYGITTFKDGTKEEGKYKSNILIVDSKVKRFFQLGSTNIRQRIDDAVKMAQQAQSMALKKAEIADTRAATARDKADQATTAALEADRDSQIAFSVARQYSDSQQQLGMALTQQQQQQQQQMMMMGGFGGGNPNSLMGNHPNMMPAAMAPMSLQMRRVSQQQQQQRFGVGTNPGGFSQMSNEQNNNMIQSDNRQHQHASMDSMDPHNSGGPMHSQQQQQQQQQMHQQQQQQYLATGPVEPFNGRRGSFRGGSQPSSGYQSGFTPRHQNPVRFGSQPPSSGPNFGPSANRQSADPFNDLFDHYKSAGFGAGSGAGSRRALSKQTSLDYNQLQGSSSRQFVGGANAMGFDGSAGYAADGPAAAAANRLRRFRMSSMDHAEENQRHQSSLPPQDGNSYSQANVRHQSMGRDSLDQTTTAEGGNNTMQNQFRHLVTSGEDLQQQQQQQASNSANSQRDSGTGDLGAQGPATGLTPTGSSYILPQSANSSPFDANQTPSPEGQGGPFRVPSGQYYGGSGQQQQPLPMAAPGYPPPAARDFQYQHGLVKQRDVHSLADEQLYMAGRRIQDHQSLLDKTAYANYDFTISSGPRMSRRCMRRTASLSRNTPIRGLSELRAIHSNAGSTLLNTTFLDGSGQRRLRSASPAISIGGGGGRGADDTFPASQPGGQAPRQQQQQHNQQYHLDDVLGSGGGTIPPWANHIGPMSTLAAPSNLTLDSSVSSGPLIRKPSLQVRYDPIELGGLMSREEVAALSHAQREQKRLEAELAEKRAKQPLLHLYLSLKEFLTAQKLVLSVLVINVFLVKLFADLIV